MRVRNEVRKKYPNRLISPNQQDSDPSIFKFLGQIKKTFTKWLFNKRASFSFVLILFILLLPVFGMTRKALSDDEAIYSPTSRLYNSQNLTLLSPRFRPELKGPTGGEDAIETDGQALIANLSPITDIRGGSDQVVSASKEISFYTVRAGDTLSQIAEMFGVKVATIRGFNNIRKDSDLRVGMELLILPIDGISYKVQAGDTLEKIAKKYTNKAEEVPLIASDIVQFNDLSPDVALVVGTELIIPNAESSEPSPEPKKSTGSSKSGSSSDSKYKGGKSYFVKAWSGPITQGFHDTFRARDYGMPIGSKVGASAAGTVMVASNGWNGGYGNFVIIGHNNGAQTLYAHLSQVLVVPGQSVTQRQTIGLSGSTGRSTGPHLHFEIRHWGDITF